MTMKKHQLTQKAKDLLAKPNTKGILRRPGKLYQLEKLTDKEAAELLHLDPECPYVELKENKE